MKPLEASVRNQFALFAEGYISPEMLTDSLPDLWEIDEAAEPKATDLIMRAIGLLSEWEMGVLDDERLRDILAVEASWTAIRSTVSVTNPKSSAFRVSVVAGRRPQVVSL